MKYLAHRVDCKIDRNDPKYAVLYDSEGEVIRRFDPIWTDEQIFIALDFANASFDKGFEWGKTAKAIEIKQALYIY